MASAIPQAMERSLATPTTRGGLPVRKPMWESWAFGHTPKYPPGFQHFDYVNPDAPRGGDLILSAFGNFDSFNPYQLKGIPAAGLAELVFEPLMEQSLDEPYSLYAHLAEDIEIAADRLSVTFRLNPKARFSNGAPVIAQDVQFRLETPH